MRFTALALLILPLSMSAFGQATQELARATVPPLERRLTTDLLPATPSLLRTPAAKIETNALLVEPFAPLAPVSTPERPAATHKFFDRTTWALTAMTVSAALADGITTQHALHTSRTSYSTVNGVPYVTVTTYREMNPIAKPLVDRGWAGQIAATALTASADLGIRSYLHKRGHHRLERVLPFAFAATSAGFATHNAGHW